MSDEPTKIDFSQKEKYDFFNSNIDQFDILIQLNARQEDCILPSHVKGDHSLTLKMSNAFVYPPQYDRLKVVANLKFNGEYFECSIPWGAIWAMSAGDENQKLWQKDMPAEVAVSIAKDILKQAGRTIQEKLGLAKSSKETLEEEPEKKIKNTAKTKKGSHLKRIK